MKLKSAFLSLCASSIFLGLTACDQANKKIDAPSLADQSKTVEALSDAFDKQNTAWKSYTGDWQFNNGELRQASTEDDFPVILNEAQTFTDLDVSVNFKPVSGEVDASGGLIFRAQDEDNYYIVRANALENNFRLYTFTDGLRHQLASANVTPPSINKFHSMRIIAVGDHIQAYLNGKLEIDHHDKSFNKGYTGLWTKADSVTVFDNFKVLQFE